MIKIPLVKTKISDAEIDSVVEVLRSGQLAQGPYVSRFEERFAAACGARHAVAVNSGTAAIHCALEACGVGAGDEVVTTPFTFAATATPILMQRATPRFVDIDLQTFNADIKALGQNITERTKAVIAVDLFGLPVNPEGAEALRERHVAIVEDACQAIGARRNGVAAGSLCDVGAFSLYATKNLMTGEGGMLVTSNDEIAKSARRFRQHGQGERYEYLSLGYNYRMTDVAAAIGIGQLERLEEITERRRHNAHRYNELLSGVPGLRIPHVPDGVEHAYHQYSILVDGEQTNNGVGRDALRAVLSERGVGSGIYYPTPLHENPLFADLGYRKGDFPNAELAARQILALPIHPLLLDGEIEEVAGVIREALGA